MEDMFNAIERRSFAVIVKFFISSLEGLIRRGEAKERDTGAERESTAVQKRSQLMKTGSRRWWVGGEKLVRLKKKRMRRMRRMRRKRKRKTKEEDDDNGVRWKVEVGIEDGREE
ncbi:hypothetical protein PABG_12678, partial [Paracoccidioides brasiliensis Pb03]